MFAQVRDLTVPRSGGRMLTNPLTSRPGPAADLPEGIVWLRSAQPVAVDPGDVRHAGVEVGHVVTKGLREKTTR